MNDQLDRAPQAERQRVKLEDLPDNARIRGMAPMGVVWWATWNKGRQQWKPDGNCPPSEFAALTFSGMIIDIPANENYQPYD